MKDQNDKLTQDAFDAPRRGRPVTGQAKTRAQIQKQYRERVRLRDAGLVMLRLDDQELRDLVASVDWNLNTSSDPLERERLDALRVRLVACAVDLRDMNG